MKILCSYITNIGKVRYKNEDSILADGILISETSMNIPEYREFEIQEITPFVVADGMGGHACGEKASRLVLEYLKDKKPKNREELKEIVINSKKYLDEYIEKGNEFCYGMGTALAGIYLSPEKVLIFNVGDCRVYRFRNGNLELLTKDHTFVFRLYEEGKITYDELRLHPERHILETAVMGGYQELPEVFVRKEEIKKGDLFLICSDGLWEPISFKEKVQCLKKENLNDKSMCLFELAYQDGKDNISFILCEIP